VYLLHLRTLQHRRAMDTATFLKWFSLIGFFIQNSLIGIIYRYAMTEKAAGERFHISTNLFVTEVLKFQSSFLLLASEHECGLGGACGKVVAWLRNPRSSLMLCVPTLVYCLQNALLQMSAGHVPVALWQVIYQGKILTTAFLSVVLLQKPVKRVQWLAITIMGAGIAFVQLSKAKEKKQVSMANSKEQNIVVGLLMLVMACCCSSFAGVFTEMIFKRVGVAGQSQEKTSLWLQNMQMSTYTMVVLVFSFIYETRQQLATADSLIGLVFQGFTIKAGALAVGNAVGGLLVALVIKYANNILRGFASAFSTINVTLLAMACFGFEVHGGFLVGTSMVIVSAMLYGGVVKVPGDWWNTAPGLCGLMVPQDIEFQKVAQDTKSDEDPPLQLQSPPTPHARVVGNSVELDKGLTHLFKLQDNVEQRYVHGDETTLVALDDVGSADRVPEFRGGV